jgi:hypothetical protein
MSSERHLLNIVRVHLDLVVARSEVQLSEEFHPTELVKELLDNGHGELVLDLHGVEGAVVDTQPLAAVGLLDEDDGHREHGRAGPDGALGHHIRPLAFELPLLHMGISVRTHDHRRCPGQKTDAVLLESRRWQARRFVEHIVEPLQQFGHEITRSRRDGRRWR